MCIMVTIINNIYQYLKFAKRVYLGFLTHIKSNSEVMDVLINLLVVMISQCIDISNHHILLFTYIQFYL